MNGPGCPTIRSSGGASGRNPASVVSSSQTDCPVGWISHASKVAGPCRCSCPTTALSRLGIPEAGASPENGVIRKPASESARSLGPTHPRIKVAQSTSRQFCGTGFLKGYPSSKSSCPLFPGDSLAPRAAANCSAERSWSMNYGLSIVGKLPRGLVMTRERIAERTPPHQSKSSISFCLEPEPDCSCAANPRFFPFFGEYLDFSGCIPEHKSVKSFMPIIQNGRFFQGRPGKLQGACDARRA